MRRLSKSLCGILTVVLAVTATCAPSFANIKDEKDKLSDLNKQKQEAQQQQNDLKASKAEAQEYINNVDKQLTNLATEIYHTGQELEETEKKIEKTQKKLTKAQDDIKVQYADMKLRIKYMYENGDSQMLDLILNSESFSDFLNKAEYITELSQYDRKMLDKMKETKKEIADAKSTLENSKEKLVTMQEQQKSDKSKLEKLSASKQEELKTYQSLLADSEDAAQALDDEISEQERRVAAAEQASIAAAKKAAEERARANEQKAVTAGGAGNSDSAGDSTPSHTSTVSGYIWPCPGHTYVSSEFGYRKDPFSGKTAYHSGIDIPAPTGTAVVAAASGTVEWANLNPTAGNWIGINHGNGVYTVYMHMSALLVAPGTKVSQGQTIGLVGSTGSSTASHLHFSVRKNGAYVSPWSYVGK